MSSSSSAVRDRRAERAMDLNAGARESIARSWSSTLPELQGVTPAAMDPARVEAAMREGYATGHAAGFEDGRAAGFAAGEAAAMAAVEDGRRRMLAALESLASQLDRVAAAEAAVRAEFTASAVDAALSIAESVVARELAVAGDPGRDAILRAFAVAPTDASAATVRLHPDDAATLGDTDRLVPGVAITVVPDPSVEPGGCELTVGNTTVDASVSAALARVREVLS